MDTSFVTLLKDAMNMPVYNLMGFPPMLVMVVGLAVVCAAIVYGEVSVRSDKHLVDSPGLLDLPLALGFAWSVTTVYAVLHQTSVTPLILMVTCAVAVCSFAMTVPVLYARANKRKQSR